MKARTCRSSLRHPNLRYLDTFGHGTHTWPASSRAATLKHPPPCRRATRSSSASPDARIVNIKVADAFGAADVSQVIAAVDWVVTHKDDPGLNIEVLNLSFGTDGVQDYRLDPLTFAVEAAWHRGIVVVVAAGNRGFGSSKLNNPAYDPYVIAVGAAATDGKYDAIEDRVAPFSSYGDDLRHPDLVAPAKSVASLRAPGSYIDQSYPQAVVGSRFFRGSGTSQAAAVVAGAAALIIEQRPAVTPDQVKALLLASTNPIPGASTAAQGAGLLDLKEARDRSTPTGTQHWPRANGLGSLDLARGNARLADGGSVLDGDRDIFGHAWDAKTWDLALGNGLGVVRRRLARQDVVRRLLVRLELDGKDMVGRYVGDRVVVREDLVQRRMVGQDVVGQDVVGQDVVRWSLGR